MASLLEITIQRRGKDGLWPVVAERHRPGTLFPVRSVGQLQLTDEPCEVLPRDYGTALGQALFRETIRDALVRALHGATDGFARVLLFVEDEDLWTWRWEWLCAPLDGEHWDFLSLHQRTPFSLYIPSLTDRDYRPIGRQHLHALVVVASPANNKNKYRLAAFDVAQTVTRLRGIFGDSKVPLAVLARVPEAAGAPTLDALVKQLTLGSGKGPYTILHLVCHGQITPEGKTALYLEDSSQTRVRGEAGVSPVEASELIEHLGRVRRLPYLVFLSACESSATKAEAEQRLGGLAQRLVRELGIPAVIGMTERVTIKTAHALAEAFYQQLLAQGKISEVDRALVEAYAGLAGRTDVNVPALYSRYGAQPLFSPALDQQLTSAQIRVGLEALAGLVEKRAPVLKGAFTEAVQKLRPLIAIEAKDLGPELRRDRESALQEVNKLCQKAVEELSFHALALGEPPPDYVDRCPFQGLLAFRPENREFFFGREALVDKLRQKLDIDPFLPVSRRKGPDLSLFRLAEMLAV